MKHFTYPRDSGHVLHIGDVDFYVTVTHSYMLCTQHAPMQLNYHCEKKDILKPVKVSFKLIITIIITSITWRIKKKKKKKKKKKFITYLMQAIMPAMEFILQFVMCNCCTLLQNQMNQYSMLV